MTVVYLLMLGTHDHATVAPTASQRRYGNGVPVFCHADPRRAAQAALKARRENTLPVDFWLAKIVVY